MTGLLHPSPLTPFRLMWKSGLFLNCNVYWDCPTGCRYCFSRLNREHHKTVGKSATDKALGTLVSRVNKAFGPRYDDTDPAQFFLHERYPVLMSNNSDPLSSLEVEHGYARQYLEVLAEVGSPVNVLSKWGGWAGLDQDAYIATFKRFDKFWAAITITADNDAALAKWEPGAPTIDERLAIIRQLSAAGIDVAVAVVPFMLTDGFPNGAWDDPDTYRPFCHAIKEAGAFGVSVSPLDFDIHSAGVLDAVCKQWVAEHLWSRSADDLRWSYYGMDLSVLAQVEACWQVAAGEVGLKFAPHEVVNTILPDPCESLSATVTPGWVDLTLSPLRVAHRLREAHDRLGVPIVTSSKAVAAFLTQDHPHREHRFSWVKCRDLVPRPITNLEYHAACLHGDGATFGDLIRLQIDDMTGWPDTVWGDAGTAPVDVNGGCLEYEGEGVVISYDAAHPRDTWASCRSDDGWYGRPRDELAEAVFADGEPCW